MPKAQPLKRDIQNTDMQLFCEYIMGYYAEAQYHFGEAQKEIGIADVILVPYMHHLYMGTLQALGYRLLAHTRATKTLFLFLPGVNDTNECVVPDATVVKHILGKEIKINTDRVTECTQYADITRKRSDSDFYTHTFLFAQLSFLRMYFADFEIVPIIVGRQVDPEKLTQLCMQEKKTDTQFVFFTNIDVSPTIESVEDLYNESILPKLKKDRDFPIENTNKVILKTFLQTAKESKNKIQDHRYTDNSDFEDQERKTIYSVWSF